MTPIVEPPRWHGLVGTAVLALVLLGVVTALVVAFTPLANAAGGCGGG